MTKQIKNDGYNVCQTRKRKIIPIFEALVILLQKIYNFILLSSLCLAVTYVQNIL